MKLLNNLLVSLLHRREDIIVCPCGYKTTTEPKALKHLSTHRAGTGTMDLRSGAIHW